MELGGKYETIMLQLVSSEGGGPNTNDTYVISTAYILVGHCAFVEENKIEVENRSKSFFILL